MITSKIRPTHLQRQAYVYLRQSTPGQVEHNRESTERQYALAARANELGWEKSQVQILDGDLGKTGKTTAGRDEFHRLMAAVGLGEVGAVFALETSRLSRSEADWHKLLDICALTDTLVVDHDGIYDPNDFNDRVLLGFKGMWSHTELHALHIRMQGAKLNKAKKGELRSALPTGYVYDSMGRLVFDADESVVSAITLVFKKFKELGTAYGVMRHFADNKIPFPRRIWAPDEFGVLKWGSLGLGRVLSVLHNPTYTGAYVYGRRQSKPHVEDGQVKKTRILQKPRTEWTVIIQGAHAAYISWEEYLENERQLVRNQTNVDPDGRRGPARQGQALLHGLIICGKCGRRMKVRYQGDQGRRPYYVCDGRRFYDGTGGTCWSVGARAIDQAVTSYVLTSITRENLDISLAVLRELEQTTNEEERAWQIRLEKARYEASRAERQYDAIEPENRLVARTLEQRWNEKLSQRDELEQAYAAASRTKQLSLSDEQRRQILKLARDFPAIWQAKTTTQVERKELLSLLVKQIALTPVDVPKRQTQASLLWHTGTRSDIFAPRLSQKEVFVPSQEVIDTVKILAEGRNDDEIAKELNRTGLRSGRNRKFTRSAVSWIRYKYKIKKPGSDPAFASRASTYKDGLYSTSALAKMLGVSIYTIHYWREAGVIPAHQESKHGPWWHKVTADVLKILKAKIRRVPTRRLDPKRLLKGGAL